VGVRMMIWIEGVWGGKEGHQRGVGDAWIYIHGKAYSHTGGIVTRIDSSLSLHFDQMWYLLSDPW
jgi:hypothetical protein